MGKALSDPRRIISHVRLKINGQMGTVLMGTDGEADKLNPQLESYVTLLDVSSLFQR